MSPEGSPADAYAGRQLIPYLGNKRALLPRFRDLFAELVPDPAGKRFIDPFAGSGSVSRLARTMGFSVAANDWEPYAEALNRCWLRLRPADLDAAFGSRPAILEAFREWNDMHPDCIPPSVPETAMGEPYLSRWYAPRLTAEPDLDGERLFYTAENAVFLDRVRQRLETELGDAGDGSPEAVKRAAFLGAAVLEAATHANTSGVFKAYHRGFGGHGGDALTRIMGRMVLEVPRLWEGPAAEVRGMDAAAFASGHPADLAYLDPPYNQHQYGSNYHLLNTLVRWDRVPEPLDLSADGRLARKAGIPAAWKKTRSPYCVKSQARDALALLLDAVDAATIVLSWNGEGHVGGDEMAELLAARGSLELRAIEYRTYRGGRQSASRKAGNHEYLYIVDTRRPAGSAAGARRGLAETVRRDRALRGRYDPSRLGRSFEIVEGGILHVPDGGQAGWPFPLERLRHPGPGAAAALEAMPPGVRERFLSSLSECSCELASEDLAALLPFCGRPDATGSGARKEALRFLRKLAHRKSSGDFRRFLSALRSEGRDYPRFMEGLAGLEDLAARRFSYLPDA